jgi:hypothetical protein
MSNRIAAARMTDRVELVHWTAPATRWDELRAAARAWLGQAAQRSAPLTLSPWLQRDIGAAAPAASTSVLDFEARRLGF